MDGTEIEEAPQVPIIVKAFFVPEEEPDLFEPSGIDELPIEA